MMHATRFRPTLPAGLPVSVTPLNPISFLLKAASINPHKVALSHPETHRSWTYQQWAIRVCNLVNALRSRGVKSGDKVFLLMPNTPAMADAIQACTAMGAILVPINIRLLPQEVEYLVMDSGASFGISFSMSLMVTKLNKLSNARYRRLRIRSSLPEYQHSSSRLERWRTRLRIRIVLGRGSSV